MSIAAKRPKALSVLLSCGVLVYAGGACLTRALPCGPMAGWVLLAGVALGSVACLLMGLSAVERRSGWRTLGTALMALVLMAMFLLAGVLVLPGCSGV